MTEESYNVTRNGKVQATPRFLPLPVSLRLVVDIVGRYRKEYTVDFAHRGWSNLVHAIEVRNRLVHPKSIGDLTVSNDDTNRAISGFYWILALVIEILEETVVHVRDRAKKMLQSTKAA